MNKEEWAKICEEFCKQKLKAKLVFANYDNLDFGCEFEDGALRHYDWRFIYDYLEERKDD